MTSPLKWLVLAVGLVSAVVPQITLASGSINYYQARVLEYPSYDASGVAQTHLKLTNGPHKGKTVTAVAYGQATANDKAVQRYRPGDLVVVYASSDSNGTPQYFINDYYRINNFLILALLILAVTLLVAGIRGLTAAFGLLVSGVIVLGFMIPALQRGLNPYAIVALSAITIAISTVYIAHGINRRTTIALANISLVLLMASFIAIAVIAFMRLNGAGSEDALLLHSSHPNINLTGLLFAGTVIGALGVLDDITVSMVTAIAEISKSNPRLNSRKLYTAGMAVGREHIASLINTLILAYAGSSIIFLILVSNSSSMPLLYVFNSAAVMEEIVRTLIGSTALVLAVPITAFTSAYILGHSAKTES